MQIGGAAGPPWLTIGAIIAVVVLLLAILGLLSVLPMSASVVFGLIAALAVARLV
jgi:hypothetical protein